MTDPNILDANLERLLKAAPARERLDPQARARIRSALAAAQGAKVGDRVLQGPGSAAQAAERHSPRGAGWTSGTRRLAAAAVLTAASLGTWAVLSGPASTGGDPAGRNRSLTVAEGGLTDVSDDADSSRTGDPWAPTGVDVDPSNERTAAASANGSEGGDPRKATDSPKSGATPPAAPGASDVAAAVTWPLDDEGETSLESLPGTMTLWVKPVVRLPLVADPVAHEVPIAWALDPKAPTKAARATIYVGGALTPVSRMGAREAVLQAEVPGAAPATLMVAIKDTVGASVAFRLQPGVTLTGDVVNEAGDPIPGAVLVAVSQVPLDALDVSPDATRERMPLPYAASDELGRWQLPHVRPEAQVQVRASAPGFAPAERTINLSSSGAAPLRFELKPGARVTGLVERPDGSPFDGALVIVSRQDGDPAASVRPVMTFGADQADASGQYEIENLPSGQFVVLLFDPAAERIPLEFRQLRIDGRPEFTVDFRAEVSTAGLSLRAQLSAPDGTPVAGEAMTLSRLDSPIATSSDWRVTDTSGDGRFSFTDIEAGDYCLHSASDGFSRMGLVWVGRLETSQELALELRPTSLTIDVEERPGSGPTWAIVEKWNETSEDWLFAGRAPVETLGGRRAVELKHLPPGRYRSVFVGGGHGATWIPTVDVELLRPASSEVSLAPGGRLSLTVLADGAPAPGIAVDILDAQGREVPQREPLQTDSLGRTEPLSIPDGPITVRLRRNGAPLAERTLEFRSEGDASSVEIRL